MCQVTSLRPRSMELPVDRTDGGQHHSRKEDGDGRPDEDYERRLLGREFLGEVEAVRTEGGEGTRRESALALLRGEAGGNASLGESGDLRGAGILHLPDRCH